MRVLLRLLVASGLAVDAYVHWTFAGDMAFVTGGSIGGDTLFRLQAVVAALAGLLVLVRARRWSCGVAFLVAASALGAVLFYTFVDIGALGPVPAMYDPAWYTEKTISATGEAVAAVAALVGFLTLRRRDVAQPGETRPGAMQLTV